MSQMDIIKPNKPDPVGAMAALKNESLRDPSEERTRDVLRRLVIAEIQKIALETYTGSTRTREQNAAIENFIDSVDEELKTLITGVGDILSIFPKYQAEVIEMVRKSLHTHIIGFIRTQGLFTDGNVFDPRHSRDLRPEERRNRRAYLQEFMAMVYDIYQLTGHDKTATERLATYYQPAYVKSLLDGSLIKKTLNENGLAWDDEKIETVFTPGARLDIGRNNSKSIPDAIMKAARNYDMLTDEAIRTQINSRTGQRAQEWTITDVQKFFTLSVRREIALNSPDSAFETITQISDVYELLTDALLADIARDAGFSFTPNQIGNLVSPVMRKTIAINHHSLRAAKPFIKQWMKGERPLTHYKFLSSNGQGAPNSTEKGAGALKNARSE